MFKKIISIITCLTLVFSSTLYGAPEIGVLQGGAASSSEIRYPNLANDIVIPSELGTIRERFVGNAQLARPSPVVVHIQDAHANYEAQKNIEAIIDFLHREYQFSLVMLEGGTGKLDANRFQFFKNPDHNNAFVEYLLSRAEVTGAESYLVGKSQEAPQSVNAYGLESAAAYREDLSQFRKVWPETEKGRETLKNIVRSVDRASSLSLNKNLRLFLKEWLHFKQEKYDLNSYLTTLNQIAAEMLKLDFSDVRNQREWPILIRMFKIKAIEPQLNLTRAHSEWEKAKGFLTSAGVDGRLLNEVENRLLGSSEETSEKTSSTRALFVRLLEAGMGKGFSFNRYPQLSLWVATTLLRHEIDHDEIFAEIESLSNRILEQLAENDREREVIELFRETFLLMDLFSLELSRENYLKILAASDLFSPTELVKQIQEVEPSSELPAKRETEDLQALFGECLKSYDLAIGREQAFVDNLTAAFRESKTDRAITITGGFHTQGFIRQLKEKQISYLVVSPRITEFQDVEKEHGFYISTLLQLNPRDIERSLRVKPVSFLVSAAYASLAGDGNRRAVVVAGAIHEVLRQFDIRPTPDVLNVDRLRESGVLITEKDGVYVLQAIDENARVIAELSTSIQGVRETVTQLKTPQGQTVAKVTKGDIGALRPSGVLSRFGLPGARETTVQAGATPGRETAVRNAGFAGAIQQAADRHQRLSSLFGSIVNPWKVRPVPLSELRTAEQWQGKVNSYLRDLRGRLPQSVITQIKRSDIERFVELDEDFLLHSAEGPIDGFQAFEPTENNIALIFVLLEVISESFATIGSPLILTFDPVRNPSDIRSFTPQEINWGTLNTAIQELSRPRALLSISWSGRENALVLRRDVDVRLIERDGKVVGLVVASNAQDQNGSFETIAFETTEHELAQSARQKAEEIRDQGKAVNQVLEETSAFVERERAKQPQQVEPAGTLRGELAELRIQAAAPTTFGEVERALSRLVGGILPSNVGYDDELVRGIAEFAEVKAPTLGELSSQRVLGLRAFPLVSALEINVIDASEFDSGKTLLERLAPSVEIAALKPKNQLSVVILVIYQTYADSVKSALVDNLLTLRRLFAADASVDPNQIRVLSAPALAGIFPGALQRLLVKESVLPKLTSELVKHTVVVSRNRDYLTDVRGVIRLHNDVILNKVNLRALSRVVSKIAHLGIEDKEIRNRRYEIIEASTLESFLEYLELVEQGELVISRAA